MHNDDEHHEDGEPASGVSTEPLAALLARHLRTNRGGDSIVQVRWWLGAREHAQRMRFHHGAIIHAKSFIYICIQIAISVHNDEYTDSTAHCPAVGAHLFTMVVRSVVWFMLVDAMVPVHDRDGVDSLDVGGHMEMSESNEAMMDEQRATHPSLAEKIDRLIKAKRAREQRSYSYKDLAAAIRAIGGASISAAYLWQLHTGVKDNPQKKTLETLANFFGVPVTYFFDTDEATRLYEQLPIALDADVRKIALRAADLSPESREVIGQMIEQARKIEAMHSGRRGMGPPRTDGDAQREEADQA